MKRMALRIAALMLVLLLGTSAAAEMADDVSLTMAEKLLKQMDFGSGFQGTLTITAEAVEGRESEAFTTIVPLVMDISWIKMVESESSPAETRVTLDLNASEYQQEARSSRCGTAPFTCKVRCLPTVGIYSIAISSNRCLKTSVCRVPFRQGFRCRRHRARCRERFRFLRKWRIT